MVWACKGDVCKGEKEREYRWQGIEGKGDVYADGGFSITTDSGSWIFAFVRVGLRGEGVCDFDLKPQEGKQRPFHI